MASAEVENAPTGEAVPVAPEPKNVLYCQVCTFPPEYCEFGEHVSKCKAWLEEANPHVYATLWGEQATRAKLASMSTKAAEELEKDSAKKERKAEAKAERERAQKAQNKIVVSRTARTKKKVITTIEGLHVFTPPLPALKAISKGFATGASISKSAKNPAVEEIVVQGDVADQVRDLILQRQKPFTELPPESAGGPGDNAVVINR